MTPAPTLHTQHLCIRGPQKSDLAAFTGFFTSDRMKALGWDGSEGEAWRGFLGGIGHWQWHGYGFFMLEETASGKPVGRVGILNHIEWPEPELAWHMFDGFEGKSLCFKAAVAVRAWAGSIGLSPLISMIAPHNARSLALAKRLGAVAESRRKDHDGAEAIVMRHLPYDAPAARGQFDGVCA